MKNIRNCRVVVFLCTAFLEYTPVTWKSFSFLNLKNFIVACEGEGSRVNEKCKIVQM